MAISAGVINDIEGKLNTHIKNVSPVSGGDINQACHLQTTSGNFFIKINSLHKYPGMFKSEERGLGIIRKTNTIAVPRLFYRAIPVMKAILYCNGLKQGAVTLYHLKNWAGSLRPCIITLLHNLGLTQIIIWVRSIKATNSTIAGPGFLLKKDCSRWLKWL